MDALLECDEFRAGALCVPRLCVHRGEFLCLHIPPGEQVDLCELPMLLTGRRVHPDIRVNGSARFAEKPKARRRFLWFWDDPTIENWLIRSAGLSSAAAKHLLDRLQISPNSRIGTLQWAPRSLVGVEAALDHKPDVLVFDSSGLGNDDVGILYRAVERDMNRLAVVVLAYPSAPPPPCFKSARCQAISCDEGNVGHAA